MQFIESDFSGYLDSCMTIQAIREVMNKNGGHFTYNDIKHIPSVTVDGVIKYLKPDLIAPFLKEINGSDYFEKHYSEINHTLSKLNDVILGLQYDKSKFEKRYNYLSEDKKSLELLDQNIRLKDRWEKEFTKGEAYRFLEIAFQQSFQSESYMTTNSVMHRSMYIALETFKFQEDEFLNITKHFNFGYWGGGSIEHYYADAVRNNNNTAWKSIEKYLNRQPFIIKGKRMYEGRKFQMFIAEKIIIELRCTGWNSDGKIKFVYNSKTGQKRLSFDLKEFKAYFKDQKFRDL